MPLLGDAYTRLSSKEHRVIVTTGSLLLIDVVLNPLLPLELTPLDVVANVRTGQRAAHAGIRSKVRIPAPLHPRYLRCFDQTQVRGALVPAFLLRANRMSNLWCMQRQQVTTGKSREAKEKRRTHERQSRA
jgi:hypothetical protein